MLALRTVGSSVRHIVWAQDGYLVSKAEGLTYVGATEEEVGFDSRPTAEGVSGLLALVPRLTPGLSGATFSHAWAGLRPGTPDRLPLLGRIPGWRGVSIAAGHFRNGILLAPITGILISDLLRDGRPRMELNPFDPGRFLVRAA
jgi:glycine oxidase